MKQYRSHVFVLCVLAVVLLTGAHNALHNALMDARFSWHAREASGDVVLVAIDPPSMEKIGVWPWPRRLHAELIGKLESAGVSDIVFDVDFSSPSNPVLDQAFADALQKAGGSVVLPSFKQLVGGRGNEKTIYVNRPLPLFGKHTWPATVNIVIDPDGLVRRYSFGEKLDGVFVPSVGAVLASRFEKNINSFLIDFGIRADSVPTVSYVDVLRGDPATAKMLKGKKIIIGGTAVELGDRFNVPNGHVISGPMLQILATESILQGRVLRISSDAVMLGGLGIIALFMLVMWRRFSARWRVFVLIGMAVATESGAFALQATFPVILDTSLWHAAIAAYLAAMAHDEIDFRGLLASIAEKRFQRIAMSLGDGLVCADRNGLITVWNPAATAIFGYESKEMAGRPFDMICAGEGSKIATPFSILDLAVGVLQVPGGKVMELEGRRKNGETFPLEACFSGWLGTDGLQYGAVLRDISVRKREEDRIRYRDIAEVSSDWIWECDEQLKFTFLSESFERVTGISAERVLGKTRHEISGDAEADWESHLEDLMVGRPFRDFRYSIDRGDGQTRYWSISGTPFFSDSGEFEGYRGMGCERTVEEQMSRKLARQAATVELMSIIAVAANQSTDVSSAFDHCLAVVCAHTGWEVGHVYIPAGDGSENLKSTKSWYLADNHRHGVFKQATERTVFAPGEGLPGRAFEQKKECWIYDVTDSAVFLRAKSAKNAGLSGGVAFPVIVRGEVLAIFEFFSTHPLDPDNELSEVINHICNQMSRVIERERSEKELSAHRDRLQKLVAKLKNKSEELKESLAKEQKLNKLQRQFVSMASHELRTPLAIIDAVAQRIKSRADKNRLTPEDAAQRVEKIRAAVTRMTRLMESTLAAARMQDGKIEVVIGPCDIGNVVRDVCERQQEISESYVISCDLADLPVAIQADTGCLEQVLTNLLSNAVKYAPDAPDIEVTARTEGHQVAISVRDHGVGIDKDELRRIGERFFRAKTSTGIAGTGIGLNLVKTLVEMHDGTLNVESQKGEGSTFTVRLPIAGPDLSKMADTKVA